DIDENEGLVAGARRARQRGRRGRNRQCVGQESHDGCHDVRFRCLLWVPLKAHRPRRHPAPHSTDRGTERKALALPVPHTMLVADESDKSSATCNANAPGGPMTACIVGWAHTPFGRLDTETVESLTVRVANEALQDAGIAAADVDEILLGHFNAGFSAQD